MCNRLSRLLTAALPLAIAATAGCAGGSSSSCGSCPPGTSCNQATGTCTTTTTGACGPGSTFNAALNRCACNPGYIDCNADVGRTGGNGCECFGSNCGACGGAGTTCIQATPNSCNNPGRYCLGTSCINCPANTFNCDGNNANACECQSGCNGSTCGSGSSCSATTNNACQSNGKYCLSGTCTDCLGGSFNCDGESANACECQSGCNGTSCATSGGCTVNTPNACGGQGRYCANNICIDCISGLFNCDGQDVNQCECKAGCNGTACGCNAATNNICNDQQQYCTSQTCTPCAGNTFNCDGNNANGCECSGGCDGTSCRPCDYNDIDPCDGDTSKWCYQGSCIACSSGFFNCNKTKGCECTNGACNGSTCAGNCSGGEC